MIIKVQRVVDLISMKYMMVKLLVLQAWHGLSDPELERQVSDRISFMKYSGIPIKQSPTIPQSGTSENAS